MAGRIFLRRQLLAAWEATIRDHYQAQEINSERGLQVFFCGALLAMFADRPRPRRIFVEPRLRTSAGEKGPMPDIVVCNSRAIIGVVELKYPPRTTAKVDKDLDSLHWIATRSQSIRLDNRRYCGVPVGSKVYSLANDAVLCWAGVHRGLGEALDSRVSDEVRPYFMEIHALTSHGEHPEIVSSYRPRKQEGERSEDR